MGRQAATHLSAYTRWSFAFFGISNPYVYESLSYSMIVRLGRESIHYQTTGSFPSENDLDSEDNGDGGSLRLSASNKSENLL